jgi:hypothetical protein
MKKALLTLSAIILICFSVYAQTSVPPLVNYQGMLTDVNGSPMAGIKKIIFSLYDSPTAATPVWGPQIFENVPLIGGRFNVTGSNGFCGHRRQPPIEPATSRF